MKNVKTYLIIIFIVIVVALGLYLFPSKTVDFCGTVSNITVNGEVFRFEVSNSDMATYTVYADKNTHIFYCHDDDPDITISEIKVGDNVQGEFNRIINKNFAKYVEVEYHN